MKSKCELIADQVRIELIPKTDAESNMLEEADKGKSSGTLTEDQMDQLQEYYIAELKKYFGPNYILGSPTDEDRFPYEVTFKVQRIGRGIGN